MDILYRILGLVATATQRLSRNSVNGIPLNWVVMVLVGIFLGFSVTQVIEGFANSDRPSEVSMGELFSRPDLKDRHIVVRGELHPEGCLAMSKKGKDDPERLFFPLVDKKAGRGIYIEAPPGGPPKGSLGIDGTVGMLRAINADLKKELTGIGRQVDGVPMDLDLMMVAGEKPSRLWIWIPAAAASAAVLLMMLATVCVRYVVFRRTRGPETGIDLSATSAESVGAAVRVTGRMALTAADSQRFVNVPAVFAQLDSGETALISNIDASVRFMGSVTRERAGLWAMVIKPGTLSMPEFGQLYCGLKSYPSFRVRYVDGTSNKPAVAILSFSDLPSLARGLEMLEKPAEAEVAEVSQGDRFPSSPDTPGED